MFELGKIMSIAALLACAAIPTHENIADCKQDCHRVFGLCKKECKTPMCMYKCTRDWINCKKECDK